MRHGPDRGPVGVPSYELEGEGLAGMQAVPEGLEPESPGAGEQILLPGAISSGQQLLVERCPSQAILGPREDVVGARVIIVLAQEALRECRGVIGRHVITRRPCVQRLAIRRNASLIGLRVSRGVTARG